jgi:hypothetical protein
LKLLFDLVTNSCVIESNPSQTYDNHEQRADGKHRVISQGGAKPQDIVLTELIEC